MREQPRKLLEIEAIEAQAGLRFGRVMDAFNAKRTLTVDRGMTRRWARRLD
jgi:hypothetical protein